ncbi:MAG: CdaR family protein [Bryobacterales bacterium]|nr:CdaR family protein [Bryobacterales bacterium]
MKRWWAENLGWKLVSLGIAVALWLTFVNNPEVVSPISVPIEFANVPADLELAADPPERVRLEIRGPARRIQQFESSSPAVVLDLNGVRKPCERTFPITPEQVKLPAGLTLVRAVPAQVRLRLERRLERAVPVRPPAMTVPDGFDIVWQRVEPAELTVVGPESRVRSLDFVDTDPVELLAREGEQAVPTQAFVRDPELRLASSGTVTLHVRLAQRQSQQVPRPHE